MGIGVVALFIVPFAYCSCVVAGSEDEQKDEWMSQKEEVTIETNPSEGNFQYPGRKQDLVLSKALHFVFVFL